VQAAAGRAGASAQSLFARIKGLPPEITPTDRFYVVSKNPPGFDPDLNGDSWVLQIDGLVARPSKLSLPQLRALPAVEQLQTLECISNEVGGDLISTARWKGVRLRDLLARAGGVGAKAVKVAFHCADGYTEAIPVADAMMPTTLLAYEMNGEPLPPSHGFPARLLVPGLFGMKNPKWIRRIEVVDYDFQGYWERSGWSDEAVVKTMSKVTTVERTHPLGEIPVGGVAYAGDRGITEVEYSVDAGKTWQKADVKPPLGPFTWVLWAAVWTPAGPGEYTVKVRAKDGHGVLQTAKQAPTLPDGASGHHTLRVRVRK
jgi:DMSO/TMAO reductase YedYZ molybdopterin-dependent catalytic subunit